MVLPIRICVASGVTLPVLIGAAGSAMEMMCSHVVGASLFSRIRGSSWQPWIYDRGKSGGENPVSVQSFSHPSLKVPVALGSDASGALVMM